MSQNLFYLLNEDNRLSEDKNENQGMIYLWKGLSLILILMFTLIFGFMPIYW